MTIFCVDAGMLCVILLFFVCVCLFVFFLFVLGGGRDYLAGFMRQNNQQHHFYIGFLDMEQNSELVNLYSLPLKGTACLLYLALFFCCCIATVLFTSSDFCRRRMSPCSNFSFVFFVLPDSAFFLPVFFVVLLQ